MGEQATLNEIPAESEGKNIETTEEESFFWKYIPEDWELVNGTEVYDVNPSYDADGEIDYIGMDNLSTELPNPTIEGKRNPEEYSGKLFAKGDVIFPRITPCTENGKRAIIKNINTEYGIGSTEFIVLSPKRKKVLPWYLFYLVNTHVVRDYAISRMRGSTGRQRVPYSVFRRELDLSLPSLPEQRKIATVLYNVDQAIQKTEEIIEQTKRVKKGLMQDLFTEGYFEHEEYKKTRLGPRKVEIPNNWEITSFDEVSEVQQGLQIAKSKRYKNDGENRYRYITVQHLKDPSDRKQRWFIENPREKVICSKDDVLMTRTGNTGEVITDVEGVFHNNFFKVDFDRDRLKKKYLVSYLKSEMVQNLLISYAGITTIPDLNHADFGRIPLLIPPKKEQKKIAQTLESVDEKIEKEKNKKEQLQHLKKGLMQDLLTGEVRTDDKDIEVLDEVMEVERSGS